MLQLANRHLARLHGRYLLRRKITGELELDIVDAWQGDATRDTRRYTSAGTITLDDHEQTVWQLSEDPA